MLFHGEDYFSHSEHFLGAAILWAGLKPHGPSTAHFTMIIVSSHLWPQVRSTKKKLIKKGPDTRPGSQISDVVCGQKLKRVGCREYLEICQTVLLMSKTSDDLFSRKRAVPVACPGEQGPRTQWQEDGGWVSQTGRHGWTQGHENKGWGPSYFT